jgi:hypothetical protein
MFTTEAGGLLLCTAEVDEREAFAAFRQAYVTPEAFDDSSRMLFKVTVDEGIAGRKPVWYVGVAHTAQFSEVLDLFNAKFAGTGAFLLPGGFGVRPAQSAGQVFMKYGHELDFRPKVELSRIAWAQR